MTGGFGFSRISGALQAIERFAHVWLIALISMLVLAGCAPTVGVQGMVYNIEGEPLPGVSVRVEQLGAFSVSNASGLFGKRPNTLSLPPGTWQLDYYKTGFTTVRQTITTGDVRSLEAPPVQLWPLPSAKGVYALDGLVYQPFTRFTPDRHLRDNNTPVFGVKLTPELALPTAPAMIISHRMATYDWQLSRMEQISVLREGFEPLPPGETPSEETQAARMETLWVASVRLPIQALPVDEPEQQLWRIVPSVELGPGIYALHWGALDGDPGTEPSAYLIEIIDPNAPPEPEETEGGAGDSDKVEEPEEELEDTDDTDDTELPAADSDTTE